MFCKKRKTVRTTLNGSARIIEKDVADYIAYLESRLRSSETKRLELREEQCKLASQLKEYEDRYLKGMQETISELQQAKVWTDTVTIPTSRAISNAMQKQADEVCPTTQLDNGILMTKSSGGITYYIPFNRVQKETIERIKRAIEDGFVS